MELAFLNLGASEVLLVLVLLFLLFGAERLPQLARSMGRFRGEMERARVQFERSLEGEEERALQEQLAFEREREAHIRRQQEAATALVPGADQDEARLRQAAEALGLETEGRTAEELRALIAAKVAGADGA